MAFLIFYVVDIEVGRAMVFFFYFSLETRQKKGAIGVVKYSFYGQNGVVLAFLGPKRRHFSHQKLFFFLFK